MRASRSKHLDARGTTLIEFGMVLPFLLVASFCMIDLSRAFFLKSMITAAARQGVRVAVVTAADPDSVLVRVNKVLSSVTGPLALSAITPTTTAPDPASYKVQVSAHFDWLFLNAFNLFGASSFSNPQTLTASAIMKKEG